MKQIIFFFGFLLLGITIQAQYTVVQNFDGTYGGYPQYNYLTLSITKDTLFGMSTTPGAYGDGLIFSMNTNGSNYTDWLDFNGTNGDFPGTNSLTLLGNTLYGMTFDGDIFSINSNGSAYTDLHDFTYPGFSSPQGSLVPSVTGDTLYGMAETQGGIFSINKNGSNFIELVVFTGVSGSFPGAIPYGSLTLSYTGDTLFGMTYEGGANDMGLIFSVKKDGTGYLDMVDFNGTNGDVPTGSLTLVGNKL